MSTQQILAFFVFAFVAAITPGPSNVMLTATGAKLGVPGGIPCLIGVLAGMGSLIFAVTAGIGGLVVGHPAVLAVIKWVGAAFLLWLAWQIAGSGPGGQGDGRQPVGFLGACLFQWINPKSWLAGASAAATYLHAGPGGALVQAVAFAALFMAAALPSGLAWLAFGAAMGRLLRSARAAWIFNAAMGLCLAASVGLILW